MDRGREKTVRAEKSCRKESIPSFGNVTFNESCGNYDFFFRLLHSPYQKNMFSIVSLKRFILTPSDFSLSLRYLGKNEHCTFSCLIINCCWQRLSGWLQEMVSDILKLAQVGGEFQREVTFANSCDFAPLPAFYLLE